MQVVGQTSPSRGRRLSTRTQPGGGNGPSTEEGRRTVSSRPLSPTVPIVRRTCRPRACPARTSTSTRRTPYRCFVFAMNVGNWALTSVPGRRGRLVVPVEDGVGSSDRHWRAEDELLSHGTGQSVVDLLESQPLQVRHSPSRPVNC
jgi:hypothetical protein